MAEKILHQRVLPLASQNLKTRLGVDLKLSAAAEALVLDKGYSEELGVRNLQRAFEEVILKPLAQYLGGCDGHADKMPDQCVVADLNPDNALFFQQAIPVKQKGLK
jgi:ATP-dependent Clp protease ATP-binding subunit ClpA